MIGAGLHTTQTVGLALATDLAPPESHPKVVALLCMMLLLGMVGGALTYGALLAHFTEIKLIQVIQGTAMATMVAERHRAVEAGAAQSGADRPRPRASDVPAGLGNLQARRRTRSAASSPSAWARSPSACRTSCWSRTAARSCILPVGTTTLLSALLAAGGLTGFGLAARWLGRGADPYRLAALGALVGLVAFTVGDLRRAAAVDRGCSPSAPC